jgi:broad specificity phosphatase PhoE
MTRLKFYLVRHGQSAANIDVSILRKTPDHAVPLSKMGELQAARTGEYLARDLRDCNLNRVRIWASPYLRARKTAKIIQSAVEASEWPISVDYREHINLVEQQFGLFDGLSDDQLKELYPLEHEHYEKHVAYEGRFWAKMPLGESRFDVAIRVHATLGTFQRDIVKGIETVIVVSHGVTLRALVMQYLHRTPEWFEKERNPKNCSVRVIEQLEDKGVVFAP